MPIVLLIGILVPLGIRSVITDDNRYGWGTFSKQVVYKVEYYWIYDSGEEKIYQPGNELRGKAKKKLYKLGNTRNSLGALKSWVNNYLNFLYENKPQDDIKTVRAKILYTINKNRKIKPSGTSQKLTLEYPVHHSRNN